MLPYGRKELVPSSERPVYLPPVYISPVDDQQVNDIPSDYVSAVNDVLNVDDTAMDTSSDCGLVDCAIDEALMEISEATLASSSHSGHTDYPSGQHTGNYTSTFYLDDYLNSGSKDTSFSSTVINLTLPETACGMFASRTADMCVQTEHVSFVSRMSDVCVQTENVEIVSSEPTLAASSVYIIDVPCVKDVIDVHNMKADVLRKDLKTVSTMTVEEDLLSQRERYYLEQIQSLQEEKMALRKVRTIPKLQAVAHQN